MAKQNLPHTRNSEAGANMYEPVIPSQFMVYLVPPTGVTGNTILTQHAKNISGLFIEKSGESTVTQTYQMATRTYDSNEKETTYDIDITFSMNLNDANQNYVYNTIRDWQRKRWNPLTGERGLKKDYTGSLTGEKYRRDGAIFWRRTAYQVFPKSNIPDLIGDYSAHDPQEIEITFVADYVTDETI